MADATEVRDAYCSEVRRWAAGRGEVSHYGCRHMPVWDGGEDADGRVHRPVWPALAAFLDDNRLDVRRFFRWRFAKAGAGPAPTPRQLMAGRLVAEYRREAAAPADRVAAEFRAEAGAAAAAYGLRAGARAALGWTKAQVDTAVVMDRGLSLSPLMRLCLAAAVGRRDLCRVWAGPAAAQYMTDPDTHDAVWGAEWLPAGFRAWARGTGGPTGGVWDG